MHEFVISLSWDQLDALLDWLDNRLTAFGVPTVLRLRVQAVVEELFYILLDTPGGQQGRLRCTFPKPGGILLEYRTAQGALRPDEAALDSLAGAPSTYGLKLQAGPGACTILVGQK